MTSRQRARVQVAVLAAIWVGVLPARASAQDPRWEVEAYGGIVAARTASEGSRELPPAGAPIVTSNPIFPSRQVSSWFFGDGAHLLNDANQEFGKASRITPLDSAFSPLDAPRAASAGVRLRRRIAPRWWAEIGVDTTASATIGADALAAAVESTRSSFQTTFADLLGSGPFSSVVVQAAGASHAGRRRETAFTVALQRRFGAWGAFVPYATAGGGLAAATGAQPSASLLGHYRFLILGEVPIGEDDSVGVRYAGGSAFVAVIGGGLQRDVSRIWGVHVDARMLIGSDPTRMVIDATPSTIRGGPSGFVESFTNPGVQFSNDPSTGRRSTLSGPSLQGFEVFKGGLQTRTLVTIGIVRRF